MDRPAEQVWEAKPLTEAEQAADVRFDAMGDEVHAGSVLQPTWSALSIHRPIQYTEYLTV